MVGITKEEAIESVKSAFDAWEYNYDTGNDWNKEHEARDMAIKALKQEPCEDAINRQAAIELIKNYCENGCDIVEDNWCPSCQREQFIELLKALPSVIPKGVTVTDFADKCRECGREKVLDKIRTEIESECCITVGRENDGAITLHDVFEIIDKYKTESEGV